MTPTQELAQARERAADERRRVGERNRWIMRAALLADILRREAQDG